ncbi:hypothetical protein OsJ_36856 [Oryza sativa Japonica Group]|uniref:Uncharacterized protein n=1 Tax=Oryza sativa subsp. japonica TaxID=39947 RepID=B9GE95_ORYSJ|nr:hypothetical protein OsJ_36856 [Oryza sativa Japonica Group]
MGAPKQKWTAEEESALKAGIAKHGAGKWRTILKDPDFSNVLRYRSNVDLKDKWRNMNVTVNASGARDRVKAPVVKKPRSAPKHEGHSTSTAIAAVTSDGDDDVAEPVPLATSTSSKRSLSRLDNIIVEAVRSLNEPTGSYKTAIANYIEEQYWPPADFDHVLSSKLNDLTASGKLIKVNRKYRIAPSSSLSEGRSSKVVLLEDIKKEPTKLDREDVAVLTKSQIDAELARMRTMTAEEAAAAAARAVAEAEAIMAEAEAAVREAEAAEADAVAAQAFAEAAMATFKNRSSAKLVIALSTSVLVSNDHSSLKLPVGAGAASVSSDLVVQFGFCLGYCTTGLPSDVLVEVGEMSFHLHKFPLLSKSAILGRLIEENSDSDECVIILSDIPGGAKSFELVARFCYGLKIELSSENVVYLRCAAEHLEMTEETSGDNLINQTESFFNQVVLRSWKDSLEALRTCDGLLPHAEDLHIVKRCIESLAGKASIDPDLFGWPVSEHSTMQSPGGSVLWNGISTGAKVRNCSSDWWYDDASSLSFPTYKRLISSMESRGIKQEIIAGSLTYYAKKFLPGLNRRQSTGPMPLPAATLSDEEQRRLLEEIDRMLPLQRGLISTNVLLWLLRTAMILKVDRACISNLEKRVGMQLDEATLEDLLLPNFSYTMDTLYNVECVHRILDHFLAMDQTMGGGGASPCLDDVMASPSLAPITAVAKLIDGYLAEIAPDINLKPLKFQSLAAVLPEYARPLDDGLYRAIDVYLKSHPTLPEAEREQLCRLIDCQKLSLEACTHAAQNERLPLRVVVQVLFFEQLQLRTSVAGCLLVSDNLEASSRTLRGGGAVAASGEAGCWARAALRENQALRVGMDSMRLRLMELERECSDMRQEIRKLGRGRRRLRGGGGIVAGGKDGGGWAARVQRMLTPRMMKLQMCSAQHDAAEQQRMNNEHKKVEKVAKNKKQLSMDDGDDEEEA